MTLGEVMTASAYGVGGFVFWFSARKKGLDTTGIGFVVLVGFIVCGDC